MFFLSPKAEGKVMLLIELQSSVARASITWFREEMPPQILSIHHHPMPHRAMGDTDRFIKVAMRSLDEAISSATKRFYHLKTEIPQIPQKISGVHYILSTPWGISNARSIKISFDKETKLTEKIVSNLVAEEREKIISSNGDKTMRVIEEKILEIRINGYHINSWRNFKTHEAEVFYALTVGSKTITAKLAEAALKIVPEQNIGFHSSLLLQHIGISKIYPNLKCYTLIHIHGETTDIALIKHRSCALFGSSTIGLNAVVRRARRNAGSDKALADSLISLYITGKLDLEHSESIKPSLDKISNEWAESLKEILVNKGYGGTLPEMVLITASNHQEFFIESFKKSHPGGRVERLPTDQIAEYAKFDRRDSPSDLTGLYTIGLCDII